MRQTTLSVSLEVNPESADRLAMLIDALHDVGSKADPAGPRAFASYLTGVPVLHFLSLSVFPAADFDPLFVIEANFDGPTGPFWGQLDAAIGGALRDMLRCCKRPLDGSGPLYDAVTRADTPSTVAAYLERRQSMPSVFHHGNRGMARARIVAEGALFTAIRAKLTPTDDALRQSWRIETPTLIHARLRAELTLAYPWLAAPVPVRRPLVERIEDIARLGVFVLLILFALTLPGAILAELMTDLPLAIVLGLAALIVWTMLARLSAPLPGTQTPGKTGLVSVAVSNIVRLTAIVVAYGMLATLAITALLMFDRQQTFHEALRQAPRGVIVGIVTMVAIVLPALVLWVRWLERRDTTQDAPPIDQDVMRQMAQREDWIPQNHMGSIVLLRPGILRAVLVRVGHHLLHLVLRVVAFNGYLGSMRTIHFAHWAFVDNGNRLMFHSNFDQSWESYLDDFIEKAHEGLTLAWGSGVGFPPTRLLIEDGAAHGRLFKAWARHSMAISRFWFSAYPNLTVDQIERNNRIATGLCRPALRQKDAEAWILDL